MNVEKGMEHNQKITFEGEADQAVSVVGFLLQLLLHIKYMLYVP